MSIHARAIVICFGIILLFIVTKELFNKRSERELHGISWLIMSVLIILLGIFPDIFIKLGQMLEFEYPPAMIFMFLTFVLLLLIFRCTKRITNLMTKLHELAMQVSLLNQENEQMKIRLSKLLNVDKRDM